MIYLNLIPSNLWFINLRSMLSNDDWKQLSLHIRCSQNWTCYCCKRNLQQLKNKKYFHAHEYWLFDTQTKCFHLACIVCVCVKCHQVIHYGYSSSYIKNETLNKWLMTVNKWSSQDVSTYIEGCFDIWAYNSTIKWNFKADSLDDWLTKSQKEQAIEFLKQKNIKVV